MNLYKKFLVRFVFLEFDTIFYLILKKKMVSFVMKNDNDDREIVVERW